MNKKIVSLSSFLFISLLLALIIFFITPDFYVPDNILPEKISKTSRIVIDNEIVMEKIDGVWTSPENEFYPLDNDTISKILENIKQASVYAQKHTTQKIGNYKIVLEDDTKEKTELFFNKEGPKINGCTAAVDHKKYYFSANITIPAQPYQWFSQPLFPFDDGSISKIFGTEQDKFSFSKLIFLQATRQDDFANWNKKNIDITLDNGIILKTTIYTQNGSYWLSAKMQTTIMPTIAAKEYVENNKQFYEGWFFEIPQPIGNELF